MKNKKFVSSGPLYIGKHKSIPNTICLITASILCQITSDKKKLARSILFPWNSFLEKGICVSAIKKQLPASKMFVPGHYYELNIFNGKYVIPMGKELLVIPHSVLEPVC